ncbi:MAG: VCBS repeat-containing protein [Bdellovibrionales bacterium]|nr:VCBS repeat-containing protein [Bdellovibrionales bacterium]
MIIKYITFVFIVLIVGCTSGFDVMEDGADFKSNLKLTSGLTWTDQPNVTFLVQADGAKKMSFSSSLNQCLLSNDWEEFSNTKNYTLTNLNGPNDVYVKFLFDKGVSECTSVTINHDNTPPSLSGKVMFGDASYSGLTETPEIMPPSANDSGAGGIVYEARVKRKSDDVEIVGWTEINEDQKIASLSLESEKEYYLEVRAKDMLGNISTDILKSSYWSQYFSLNPLVTEGFTRMFNFEVGDLDSDGDSDIFFLSGANEEVFNWLENTDGNYILHIVNNNLNILGNDKIKIVDLDKDNDNDIVVGSYDFDGTGLFTIYWLKNDGVGGFTNQETLVTGTSVLHDFIILDFDNDNDLDIVSGSASSTEFNVLVNDGSNNFNLIQKDTTRWSVYLGAGDFNEDGYMDFVASGSNQNTMSVLINDTSNQYIDTQIGNELDTAVEFMVNDFDGDNHLDIISWGTENGVLGAYKGDGSGGFTYSQIDTFASSFFVFFDNHDFDNDGDLDFLLIGVDSDSLYYYENNGGLSFTKTLVSTSVDNRVKVRNIDDDPELEILSGSMGSSIPDDVLYELKFSK